MCDLLGPQTLHRSVGSGERELVITSNLAPDVSAKAAETLHTERRGIDQIFFIKILGDRVE